VHCSSTRLGDLDQLVAHALGGDLDLAGALHGPQMREGLRQGVAPGQQSVVARRIRIGLSPMREHARAFLELTVMPSKSW
jgi:hypothetical protein